MLLFFKKTVPADYDGGLNLAGYSAEYTHYEADGMALDHLHAFVTDPITTGSITVTATMGPTEAVIVLSPGKPRGTVTISGGLAPGQTARVSAISSADLYPTVCDLIAIID